MSDRYATYNITTNRFKFYPGDERLPEEENERRRRLKFNWYPGQKCFSAIWSPGAEDWILKFVDEIQFDETFDDVDGRVERYEKYAEKHEKNAEYAQERFANANTARQARQAENTAAYSLEAARHWQDRIQGAIRWAEYKDKPDVIGRRIKKLEASQRKHEKEKTKHEKWVKTWKGIPGNVKKDGQPVTFEEAVLYLKGWDSVYFDVDGKTCSAGFLLEDGTVTHEQVQAKAIEKHESGITFQQRWLDHLAKRLTYEKAYLAFVAGEETAEAILAPKKRQVAKAPDDGLKKGDIVTLAKVYGRDEPVAGPIVSMGAKSVTVEVPEDHPNYKYYSQWSRNKKGQVVRSYRRKDVKKVEA